MNDQELEKFEADLQRLKPAKPATAFMARLAAATETATSPQAGTQERSPSRPSAWWLLMRWLLPACATVAVVTLAVRQSPKTPVNSAEQPALDPAALKADDIQFDQNLVASFDAVAQMPNGEPVRFRCREWSDGMTFRDSSRGIVVEQRTPRLEVTPVSFETY